MTTVLDAHRNTRGVDHDGSDRIAPPNVRVSTTQRQRNPPNPMGFGTDRLQQHRARLKLVRWTRASAVGITVVIGVASFVLSFSSLCDLAGRTAWPGWLAWLWPVIVDGAIVLATMALVALSAYPEQRSARRYFWALLIIGALVSVAGNAFHALMIAHPPTSDQPFGTWVSAAIACVPPIALVGATEALSILWRFTPYDMGVEPTQVQDNALALAAERLDRWDAVAAAIHDRGLLPSLPTSKIADVVRLLHDEQPALSLRQLGQRVELHHDMVGRIREAAAAVLGDVDAR